MSRTVMASCLCLLAGAVAAAEEPGVGWQPGSPTRAMQADDSLNPGMLLVLDGEARWGEPAGSSVSASCHWPRLRSGYKDWLAPSVGIGLPASPLKGWCRRPDSNWRPADYE
jgi:hypothetical protein